MRTHATLTQMPRRTDIDPELRRRLAAWTVYFQRLHEIPSKRALARRMGLSGPTVTNAINRQSGIGLDYLVALRDTFKQSADQMLDDDPPALPRVKG